MYIDLDGGREGEGIGKERGRGGWDGRDDGNEWRNGVSREGWLMKGTNEEGKEGREAASGGGIGRGREGAREEGEQGMERNSKGGIPRRALASVQYIHKPSHNADLGLDTLVLQMKNSVSRYKLKTLYCDAS